MENTLKKTTEYFFSNFFFYLKVQCFRLIMENNFIEMAASAGPLVFQSHLLQINELIFIIRPRENNYVLIFFLREQKKNQILLKLIKISCRVIQTYVLRRKKNLKLLLFKSLHHTISMILNSCPNCCSIKYLATNRLLF